MSYDENRMSDLIDGGIHKMNEMEMKMKTKLNGASLNGASLTTEEREQFFGLYTGQDLYNVRGQGSHLELKSLSSISDEDAINAIMISLGRPDEKFSGNPEEAASFYKYSYDFDSKEADYLRCKGYLLGATLMNKEGVCTHYTAEELIEYGVAKIR